MHDRSPAKQHYAESNMVCDKERCAILSFLFFIIYFLQLTEALDVFDAHGTAVANTFQY